MCGVEPEIEKERLRRVLLDVIDGAIAERVRLEPNDRLVAQCRGASDRRLVRTAWRACRSPRLLALLTRCIWQPRWTSRQRLLSLSIRVCAMPPVRKDCSWLPRMRKVDQRPRTWPPRMSGQSLDSQLRLLPPQTSTCAQGETSRTPRRPGWSGPPPCRNHFHSRQPACP